MRRSCFHFLLTIVVISGCLLPARANGLMRAQEDEFSAEELAFFEAKVRPLFAARCYECHGESKQESDLRLDSRQSIMRGGASEIPAAVPGAPDESLLLDAIREGGDFDMPPDAPLDDQEIETIATWISMGLPWPDHANVIALSMEERIEAAKRDHWAFQPLTRPSFDSPGTHDWPINSIDAMVLDRLSQHDMSPSPDATKWEQLRRLKYDLLGLPPTADEMDSFLADTRPDAYEMWVDRFMTSPAFGERWGRHWLDVARYGDTRGYAFDRDRRYPYAYSYRDYVIRSFNDDLAYDRFVMEQLAADAMEPEADPASLAALGFLTTGRRFNNIHDDIDDQIDTVTRGLLGLTVACSRCHDHKYDAIGTEDYYSLYGVFASIVEPGELPLIGDTEEIKSYQSYLERLNARQSAHDQFVQQQIDTLQEHGRMHVADYLLRVLEIDADDLIEDVGVGSLSDDQIKRPILERWRRHIQNKARSNDPVFGLWAELNLSEPVLFEQQVEQLTQQLSSDTPDARGWNPLVVNAFLDLPPANRFELARIYGKVFTDMYLLWKDSGADDAALARLPVNEKQIGLILLNEQSPTFVRGENLRPMLVPEQRQEFDRLKSELEAIRSEPHHELPRAMIVQDRPNPFNPFVFVRGQPGRRGDNVPRRFLAVLSEEERTPFANGSGRIDLARQIVDPNNPLTARVIANRVWMHHFGQPLVDSPSDFGIRSDSPLQSELLDHLARFLIEHDWSLKALHRLIVTSRTYRQSSVDREDCRLADPDNRLLWRMNRRRLEFEPLRDSILFVSGELSQTLYGKSESLTGEQPTHRRAIYGTIDRQDLPNLLRTFDFASPDQSVARRPQTVVPQQALFLMNAEFVLQRAQAIAASIPLDVDDPDPSITTIYRLVFARPPSAAELQLARTFLTSGNADMRADQTNDDLSRWERFAHLLLMTNEFAFVD